jgi:hypothetical protein
MDRTWRAVVTRSKESAQLLCEIHELIARSNTTMAEAELLAKEMRRLLAMIHRLTGSALEEEDRQKRPQPTQCRSA